jgi:hypothetical protein
MSKLQVLTANRLATGEVVYLAAEGRWLGSLAEAAVAADAAMLSGLERVAANAMARREVIAAYPMEVTVASGQPAALSVRERIRAAGGPTI